MFFHCKHLKHVICLFSVAMAMGLVACGGMPKKAQKTYSVKEVHYGSASWYGKGFHGKRTASGERFNMHDNTAAHRTLPFGTMLLVTNVDNQKSVEVRVNDRGPFIKSRLIDLSYAAAHKLGFVGAGHTKVKVSVLGEKGK